MSRIAKRYTVAPTERKSMLSAPLALCLSPLTGRYFGSFPLRLDALHMQSAPFAEWSQCIRERVAERRECIVGQENHVERVRLFWSSGAIFPRSLTGWLGREDLNLEMVNWISDAIACPREATEPVFVELHKSLETSEFREPYRIGGVQSFGEKRVFRRIISRLCRSGVRSSNEKSPLLLGLIANKFTRRAHGFGQAGGGRGTGIQPSPRSPE
jgi:hypothetical protein